MFLFFVFFFETKESTGLFAGKKISASAMREDAPQPTLSLVRKESVPLGSTKTVSVRSQGAAHEHACTTPQVGRSALQATQEASGKVEDRTIAHAR